MDEMKYEFTAQELMNMHNALIHTTPTGEDIIAIGGVVMDIRRKLSESENKKEGGEKE